MNIQAIAQLAGPIILAVLTIFFIAIAVIIAIREKKSSITNRRDEDFIDKFIAKKKKEIKATPNCFPYQAYFTIMAIAPIALGAAAFYFIGNFFLVVVAAFVGVLIPELLLRLIKKNNDKDFDEKYGRALKQMSSAMRSGLTIQQAVDDVCSNPFLDRQIKEIFVQISSDIKVGIPVADAFKRSADARSTCDTRDMASAMAMQSQVGGNESAVVENVSMNINKRIMLRKEIKTLFAGAKMTVLTMDFLPPILLAGILLTTPTLGEYFFSDFTNTLILIGLFVLMGIGTIVAHKMLNSAKVGSE